LHNVFWSNASINSARGNKEFGYRLDQFEPADEWKGDVARALLYMAITYQHREDFDKTKIDIDLMFQWSKMDSPSLEEIEWNHWIKENSIQKNSNQFIDNPWLSGFVV
jgi:endonuclease I